MSGKGRGIAHDAGEREGRRPCGGTVGEALSDLAGSGQKWHASGGSARKAAGAWSMTVGAHGMAGVGYPSEKREMRGREKRRWEGDGRPEEERREW